MAGPHHRRRTSRILILVVGIAMLIGAVSAPIGTVAAQQSSTTQANLIQGEPTINASAPAPTLTPGQSTELTLQVTNNGTLTKGGPDQRAAVVTAHNVRVEASAEDAPFEIESGVVALGSVGEQRPHEVNLAITVPEDAEPGTYDVDVNTTYSHVSEYWTSRTTQYADEHNHSVSETVEIDIEDTPRFELSNVSTDAQVGTDGTLEATLENVGSERAEDIRLALKSASPGISLASSNGDESYISSLAPGEATSVTYDVSVRPDTSVRAYSIGGTVQYADSDGLTQHYNSLAAGLRPIAEQDFSLQNASGDLRAGEERPLTISIRNDGPRAVTEPVVTLNFDNPNVYLDTPRQAIEDLEPNETATVTYSVDVSSDAQESHQAPTITTTYTNADGDRLASDPITVTTSIGAERDRFDIQVVNGTVTAGSTDTVELLVTNAGDRPISEIEAKAYLNEPLDSTDDAAMISALDPGESASIAFDVSAAGSAPEKTYSLSTDFHYERDDGDAELSRTYAVPIDVESPPETDLPSWLPAIAVISVILVLVLIWQRQRVKDLVR